MGLALGATVGVVLGAVFEALMTGDNWHSLVEDILYPLAFLLAVLGVLWGGLLLLAAEHGGDQQRAWRAAAVFVASAVLAALLFWGAL